MPSHELRPTIADDVCEPEGLLLERLRRLCVEHLGLLFYHPFLSKRSTPGWPDVAIVHPDGGPLYLWELKSASGTITPAQRRWLDALERVTRVETGVYRPQDWARMQHLLVERS